MEKEAILKAANDLAQRLDATLMPILHKWVEENPSVPADVMISVMAGAAGQTCGLADGNLEQAKQAMEVAYKLACEIRRRTIAQGAGASPPSP